MISRCVRSALQPSNGIVKGLARDVSRRTFTSSLRCQKHGPVPKFSKTSSPELDSLLSTIRTKIILPAHLSESQRKLIYKTKNIKTLSAEPIIATLDGEDFQLEHINKLKDVPKARRSVVDAASLMKDKNDWDQLPPLLEGLNNANRMKYFMNSRGIRDQVLKKAAKAGRLDVILECARRVDATGFRLNQPGMVAKLTHAIQMKALRNKGETKQALSWSEMVLDMIEEDRHVGRKKVSDNDPRSKIEVMGAPLHLAALRASLDFNGEDKDGKVQKYAEKVLGTSLQDPPPQTDEGSPLTDTKGKVFTVYGWLVSVLPVLHGMKVAQKILDSTSPVAMDLKKMSDSLEETAKTMRGLLLESAPEGKSSYGLELYDQLLGEENSRA